MAAYEDTGRQKICCQRSAYCCQHEKTKSQQVGISYYVQNKSQQVGAPLADFKIPMNHNARSILFDTSETFGYFKGTDIFVTCKIFFATPTSGAANVFFAKKLSALEKKWKQQDIPYPFWLANCFLIFIIRNSLPPQTPRNLPRIAYFKIKLPDIRRDILI